MTTPFADLTPAHACAALRAAGLDLHPADVRVERREHRWAVHLPGPQLAWFAATATGRARLDRERAVLRLLAERCRFLAPRVLYEDPGGHFELRSLVPGQNEPWRIFEAAQRSTALAQRLGTAIGELLAEQHGRINAADLPFLPARPDWPEPSDWIDQRLGQVTDDRALLDRAAEVLAAYEALPVAAADRVLVHADVGFHNLGIDPTTFAVLGIFDYDGAACADRHHDFRYLLFDQGRYDLIDAARTVYEPAVGRAIDLHRVRLHNAACALSFLAYRAGSAPDDASCGRTLAQDLAWSRHAIAEALAGPG